MAENGNSKGNAINWATVVLVALSGGGNLLATKTGNDFNEREIHRAIEEIHQLYPRLNEAIDRQKVMQQSLDDLKRASGR